MRYVIYMHDLLKFMFCLEMNTVMFCSSYLLKTLYLYLYYSCICLPFPGKLRSYLNPDMELKNFFYALMFI